MLKAPPTFSKPIVGPAEFLGACELLGFPTMVVGASGRILGNNNLVPALFGAAFGTAGEQITLSSLPAGERLRKAIAEAALGINGAAAIGPRMLPRDTGRPLIVYVTSSSTYFADQQAEPSAILVLIDPDQAREPSPAFLREAFHLTAAETALTILLFRGKSLKEIATVRNTSIATVRVQLRSVFAKTCTNRQSELVALLARLPSFT